ncbi:hypothetical protein XaFJ1_GM001306 [Xanthomonas albilineans]|nr:hypothetical protein XaFJ1_GM001306 [Xanthomonas albilineans]
MRPRLGASSPWAAMRMAAPRQRSVGKTGDNGFSCIHPMSRMLDAAARHWHA